MNETLEDWLDRLTVVGLGCVVSTGAVLLGLPWWVGALPVLAGVLGCVWMALPEEVFGTRPGGGKTQAVWPLEQFAKALPDREVPETRLATLYDILTGMGQKETAADIESACEVRVEASEDHAYFASTRMVFDNAPRGYRCTVFRSADGKGSIYVESYRSV